MLVSFRRSPLPALALLAVVTSTAHGDCSATLTLNGYPVTPTQLAWLANVGTTAVPALGGSAKAEYLAAEVMWWGLKEGTIGQNPYRYSECTQRIAGCTRCARECFHDVSLPATGVCDMTDPCKHFRAWQVGLAGVQVSPGFDVDAFLAGHQLGDAATILDRVARQAGYSPVDPEYAAITTSTGLLRQSWLLRDLAVGITIEARQIHTECFGAGRPKGWCFKKPPPACEADPVQCKTLIGRFAPSRPVATRVIRQLQVFFQACQAANPPPPTCSDPSFPVLCAAEGFCCPSGAVCNAAGCCGEPSPVACGGYCCGPGSVCGEGNCTDPCPAEMPVACGAPIVCCAAGSVCGRDCNTGTTSTTIPGSDCRCFCPDGSDCSPGTNHSCGVDELGIPNVCGCPVSCP